MSLAVNRNAVPPHSPRVSSVLPGSRNQAPAPFFGLLEGVIVAAGMHFDFPGAIRRDHADLAWTWVSRDLAPDLLPPTLLPDDPAAVPLLEAAMPELLSRIRGALSGASTSFEAERRLKSQLGGQPAWDRLPILINALKHLGLLEKAKAFGRATNGLQDDGALGGALQSMPLKDQATAALLMHVAIGQVANPMRLVTAVVRIAGSGDEAAVVRAGFSPLIDAILAHAQDQLPAVVQVGAFADVDLICRAIERFHKLVRAISGSIEISRGSRWAGIITELTKTVSERVEPKLRSVPTDVNLALRRQREGADRHDSDQLLAALNGVFLLATVRECRDSLAVNQTFDQVWGQTGQALEMHITRNLDILRDTPSDGITLARLEVGIKMAELRFNADYADVLRRARDGIVKRA